MTVKFDRRPPKVVVFTGNMHRPSHSRALGAHLAHRLNEVLPVSVVRRDLVDAGRGLGSAFSREELSPTAGAVLAEIETADALIALTPTYKGSMTGLFKHMFDFVDPLALVDRPVLIGATGGGYRHALMVEHQLRPLFGFFSALTVPTSVYASDTEFIDGEPSDPLLLERAEQAVSQLAVLLSAQDGRRSQHDILAHSAANLASGGAAEPLD